MKLVNYEEHLKKIVEILVANIPSRFGLTSIVLYGGFARGEGRMIAGADGNIPYGDYDFMVITKQSLPEDLIQKLLYDKIYGKVIYGTSIDITNETVSGLKTINCDLSSYDLLKTGRTIWGKELLDRVAIDIEDIPILSFLRIINNRLNVILMEYEKRDSLRKSIIKLYLDIGSYLAFIHKAYSPFFEERIKTLKKMKLDHSFQRLVEKIEIATGEKLNPQISSGIGSGEPIDALGYGAKIMQDIIANVMNRNLGSLSSQEVAELIYRKFPVQYYQDFIETSFRDRIYQPVLKPVLPLLSISANLYENIYFRKCSITRGRFSFRYEWRSPIIINMAIIFLLVYFLIEGRGDYLKEAQRYLRKVSLDVKENDFENIRYANTNLWLGYTRRARKRNLYKALSDLFVK